MSKVLGHEEVALDLCSNGGDAADTARDLVCHWGMSPAQCVRELLSFGYSENEVQHALVNGAHLTSARAAKALRA